MTIICKRYRLQGAAVTSVCSRLAERLLCIRIFSFDKNILCVKNLPYSSSSITNALPLSIHLVSLGFKVIFLKCFRRQELNRLTYPVIWHMCVINFKLICVFKHISEHAIRIKAVKITLWLVWILHHRCDEKMYYCVGVSAKAWFTVLVWENCRLIGPRAKIFSLCAQVFKMVPAQDSREVPHFYLTYRRNMGSFELIWEKELKIRKYKEMRKWRCLIPFEHIYLQNSWSSNQTQKNTKIW